MTVGETADSREQTGTNTKAAMKKEITVGTKVRFESDDGPQRGQVADIKPDLGNGQRIALVNVPGTMNSRPWHVPVNDLQHDKAAA